MTFGAYASAGFGPSLLPILPPDALIHPESPGRLGLEANRGKVPGRKTADGWFGMGRWNGHEATPEDLRAWTRWGCGIGMQGRLFPALDIDIVDEELADAVHTLAVSVLGAAPTRFGRGARRLLVFAGPGFAKRRLAFRHARAAGAAGGAAGGDTGRQDQLPDDVLDQASAADSDRAAVQAVELLADGQQYVVEGIHPRTGQPYRWTDERSPAQLGSAALTTLEAAKVDAFFVQLEALLELYGYEVVTRSGASAAARTGDGAVWQEGLLAPSLEALARALAAIPNEVDYDTWLKVGVAAKAACGLEREADGFGLWESWSLDYAENTPELVAAKWASFRAPFLVGWPWLAGLATHEGDGSFSAAAEDFADDAVAFTEADGEAREPGPILPEKLQALFDRWVWVERLKRVCDLRTGDLLDREQFNVRNSHIGDPTDAKACAWATLLRDGRNLQAVASITYRPGAERIVHENLPGLMGKCINVWRKPDQNLPAEASDADVQRWLEHVAFLVPDDRERATVLDWLAWIIQNPGLKPNWSVLLGSTQEGVGKDLMLEPVRLALGAENVREIGPGDLMSTYTWFLSRTRLVIVEEMHGFDRKETMNRLKPLIAAPPYTLTVNAKFEPQYEIPNIVAAIFFTNMDNALAISGQDRRYFVAWTDTKPRSPDYYEGLVDWYASGGAALAARWLMLRDVSGFNAKGRAPDTEAKQDMRIASRSSLEAWVEDCVADCAAPFDTDVVALDDVWARMPDYVAGRYRPSRERVAATMKRLGCERLGRVRLGRVLPTTDSDRAMLWAVRRVDMLRGLDLAELRGLYLEMRDKAAAA